MVLLYFLPATLWALCTGRRVAGSRAAKVARSFSLTFTNGQEFNPGKSPHRSFEDWIWTMWKRSVVVLVLLAIVPAAKARILNTNNAKNSGVAAIRACVGVSDDAEAP